MEAFLKALAAGEVGLLVNAAVTAVAVLAVILALVYGEGWLALMTAIAAAIYFIVETRAEKE